MQNKYVLWATIMVLLIFILSGCTTDNTKTTSKITTADSNVVINLAGGDWGYPTPYAHYMRGSGVYKMRLIFDSLLERGEKGLIPWLAEKWDISADGHIYTFYLRKNVKWHDGKSFSAEDVSFSLAYYAKYPPVADELHSGGKSIIQEIEVLDKDTVRIKVNEPNATFLGKIGIMRILPKHIWHQIKDPRQFTAPEAVVGCGPYILQEYNREQGAYRFVAFKDYWGPKPKVAVIQFVPVSDNLLAFDKGDIDLTSVTPDVLGKYQNNAAYAIKQNPAFWGYRLIFNMTRRPELQDVRLRQAFAHAVNVSELIEKVARGAAKPASAGYLPVDHIWYNKKVQSYSFNPEIAKNLLHGNTYSFDLLTANTTAELRIATLLKISLAQVGIQVNVKSADMKTRDAAVKSGAYELALIGHGGWGYDPDMLCSIYANALTQDKSPHALGIRGYSNPVINDLAEQQRLEQDPKIRKQLVYRLQEQIASEVPQLPLYNTTSYIVYQPQKFDGWKYMFDHHEVTHNKLSYLDYKSGEK